MKVVKHIPKNEPSHAHTMERMAHRAMLEYIRTFNLLNPQYKLLNITVNEEHERWKEHDEQIRKYD